jgi:hypothetical protein
MGHFAIVLSVILVLGGAGWVVFAATSLTPLADKLVEILLDPVFGSSAARSNQQTEFRDIFQDSCATPTSLASVSEESKAYSL